MLCVWYRWVLAAVFQGQRFKFDKSNRVDPLSSFLNVVCDIPPRYRRQSDIPFLFQVDLHFCFKVLSTCDLPCGIEYKEG